MSRGGRFGDGGLSENREVVLSDDEYPCEGGGCAIFVLLAGVGFVPG